MRKSHRTSTVRLLHALLIAGDTLLRLVSLTRTSGKHALIDLPRSHRNVRSMYMWCPACGHGAHPACVAALYTTLSPGSARASISAESPVINISHPSTPGIATPLRNWMWGEDSLEEAEEAAGDSRSRLDRRALSGCPAGLCGHSPCLLAGPLE